MTTKTNKLKRAEVQKPEVLEQDDRVTYTPNADITVREDGFTVAVDLPGVAEKNVNIELEDNVLTITGRVDAEAPEAGELLHRDYDPGNYERSFTLPADIDRERIEAQIKDGVLKLVLPKSAAAQPKRIAVTSAE